MSSYTIGEFRIDAEVIKTSHGDADSVSFQLFYPVDNYGLLATAVLERDISKEIYYKAADGFTIKGKLLLTKRKEMLEIVLIGYLDSGFESEPDLQRHFEGIIFVFPRIDPIDPPTI